MIPIKIFQVYHIGSHRDRRDQFNTYYMHNTNYASRDVYLLLDCKTIE